VTDAWQGCGVGTELLRSLAQGARANGIRWLVGDSLAENHRILGWARRFGFDARTEPGSGGLVRVTLDLASLAP
jgi:L-amino acid N-acyltransferase YncA